MKLSFAQVVIFLVFLSACTQNNKPVDLAAITKHEEKGYEIDTVIEKPLSSYVRLPGQLKPFEEVKIFAKVSGFVKNISVDRGAVVRKGQVLVRLDAPETESQIQAAISKYTQAQENATASREKYNRLKEAAKEEGAVAPLDIDNALSRMKAEEAIVEAEKSNISSLKDMRNYLTITAPFDGVIIERSVSPGALVGPGSRDGDAPMVVLQYLDKLRLEVFIPEAYADNVDLKKPATIVYNSFPDKEFTASISRSARALSTMRAEAIEIDLENKDRTLKPGMFAEIKIPLLSSTKSTLVKNNCVVRSTERQYVIVLKNGKTKFIDVKEGLKSNDYTEVFGDLKNGDRVLVHATDEIPENLAVR